MTGLWDGDSMAEAIGRALEREGFVPFGVGLPFAAERAAWQWLADQRDKSLGYGENGAQS